MTVNQLLSDTSSAELSEWMAYFIVENEETEICAEESKKKAEAEARAKRGG